MAQFQSPETYVDGQQVTAARLNNQTNGAIALPGLINDQYALAAGTLAAGDTILIYDTSATGLRKAVASDFTGSNLPVIASSVTTSALLTPSGLDLAITPSDGTAVTGKTFTSIDGLAVTVSSVAHGLSTSDLLQITASNAEYSGLYPVTVTSIDSFTYAIPAYPYVYGKTFTSSNGITVTVTSNSHGLSAGNVVSITCSNSAYSGSYTLTAVTTNTFTYTLSPTTTADSGTCYYIYSRPGTTGTLGYTKKATTGLSGNAYLAGRLYVDGDVKILGGANISGDTNISGSLTIAGGNINGNVAINGNLLIGTNNTLTLDKDPVASKEATTKQYVDAKQYPRAWVRFGAGSGGTISDSHNIASATRTSAGQYTITFTTAMPNANYVVLASFTTTSAGQPVGGPFAIQSASYNLTTTGFTFLTSSATVFVDFNAGNGSINLVVFGD